MKKIFLTLSFLSSLGFGEIKISQLPLGTAAVTTSADSFPFVNFSSSATEQMKLWDLVNLPTIQNMTIQSLNLVSASLGGTQIQLNNTTGAKTYGLLTTSAGLFQVYNFTGGFPVAISSVQGDWTFGNPGNSGVHQFNGQEVALSNASGNNESSVLITNSTSGTTARSTYRLTNDVGNATFELPSTGYTTVGPRTANSVLLSNQSTGSTRIASENTGGNVEFWTGGAAGSCTRRAYFDPTGNLNLLVGLNGVTTNSNASSGQVGEYISAQSLSYTNTASTTNFGNVTSISLTAGDWDVSGVTNCQLNGATATVQRSSITTNSAGSGTEGVSIVTGAPPTVAFTMTQTLSNVRASLASTTTYYLTTALTYSIGTPQCIGSISARRVR